MKTTEEVGYIYELAKSLMDEREKDYQGSWREEGLGSAVHSAYKKGSQMRVMFESGRWRENMDRIKEDCLDGINYFVFCYRCLDKLLEKEEK
jgi:hypothetical protein